MPAFQRPGALLPPGPPQQETQQVEHEHGGLGERAEEGLVVLLPLENVLREESTGRTFTMQRSPLRFNFYVIEFVELKRHLVLLLPQRDPSRIYMKPVTAVCISVSICLYFPVIFYHLMKLHTTRIVDYLSKQVQLVFLYWQEDRHHYS